MMSSLYGPYIVLEILNSGHTGFGGKESHDVREPFVWCQKLLIMDQRVLNSVTQITMHYNWNKKAQSLYMYCEMKGVCYK